MGAVNPRQVAAATLRGVLEMIDAGQLEASTAERAYIAGSLEGLETLEL